MGQAGDRAGPCEMTLGTEAGDRFCVDDLPRNGINRLNSRRSSARMLSPGNQGNSGPERARFGTLHRLGWWYRHARPSMRKEPRDDAWDSGLVQPEGDALGDHRFVELQSWLPRRPTYLFLDDPRSGDSSRLVKLLESRAELFYICSASKAATLDRGGTAGDVVLSSIGEPKDAQLEVTFADPKTACRLTPTKPTGLKRRSSTPRRARVAPPCQSHADPCASAPLPFPDRRSGRVQARSAMTHTRSRSQLLRASLIVTFFIAVGSAARADIPAGYKGTPFDPAVAGGMFNNMPTTAITTAGPYPIPGRLEFENYDMGGLNVGYFTTDHIGCAGGAYRKDVGQTASLCATSPMPDTGYGAALTATSTTAPAPHSTARPILQRHHHGRVHRRGPTG